MTKNKYHAKKAKCAYCDKPHDSKKEAARCNELHALAHEGKISNLKGQVRFEILPFVRYDGGGNERGIYYVADFVYFDLRMDEWIIEDVKSKATREDALYIVKRKLVKYRYCRDNGDGKRVFRFIET